MEVIIIAGPPGSGKDTVADMLAEYGWKKFVFSDALREEFRRVKGRYPRDKLELLGFSKDLRRERGRGVAAELLWERMRDTERALAVGARSPEEVEFLRKRAETVLLLVDAPPELREARTPGALKREERERELGIEEVFKMADAVIYNDGNFDELKKKVEYFLANLKWYKVGLRAGLEVHQQLDTGKLFCSCPSELVEKDGHKIERYLRPVASEMGEYDRAALTEFLKGNKYIYIAPDNASCLVELDEEPPHPPNPRAVEAALTVAHYLNMKVFPYVQVMRKIVIDGSNTTGFQRTMLMGVDGELRTETTRVKISTLCLEEDAARPVERGEGYVVYKLDRLGIPLIEISTAPDMRTPGEVKEVAHRIGMLLRATGKVKRGLGTIRQDINISIRGGARVEIKGVQELEKMDRYVELEVERQLRLLQLRDLMTERSVKVEDYKVLTDNFRETGARFIRKALERGEVVLGFCVRSAKGLLGFEVNHNRRFGTELADYVKVHAGLGGILHSDELPAYGVTDEEVEKIRKVLGCRNIDAFILLVGKKDRVLKGYEVLKERIEKAKEGVPPETRSPREDGTTSYARPLPGAARMYPETDLPPLLISEQMLDEIRRKAPPLPEERKEAYQRMGLSKKIVEDLVKSRYVFLFDYLVGSGIEPKLAASLVVNKVPYWKREGIDVDKVPYEVWADLLRGYEREYPKTALDDIVKLLIEGYTVQEAVDKLGVRMLSEEETRRLVEEVVEEFRREGKDLKPGAVIGEVMRRSGGRASGKLISEILRGLT